MEHQTPVQEVPVQEAPPSVQTEEKKSSVFTKWWFWLIILVLIIVAAFFIFQTTQDEEVTEEQETVSPPTEEEIQQPELETETTLEGAYVSWDSLDIPTVFLEYTYGDIVEDFFDFSWETGGVPNFLTIYNTTQDDIRMYVDEAVSNGWELQWEEEVMGDEENSWSLYLETEETVYTTLLEYHLDEKGEYLVMILGEGTVFD